MPPTPAYPSPEHALAAEAITAFFARQPAVDTVLLTGSCARGKAGRDSCLDILVLCRPEALLTAREPLEQAWQREYERDPLYARLLAVGAFSHVDLEFSDAQFDQEHFHHGWTSGADAFELEIGNTLAYSVPLSYTVPLGSPGSYYQALCQQWLPYYAEDLRRERLAMVTRYCRNNLAHIPLYAPRELYFQCFKRLYHAFEEFLQGLFIARRTYPIAYDKWVKEGVVDILGLPELYAQLPALFEIRQFESLELVEKASQLEALVDQYLCE